MTSVAGRELIESDTTITKERSGAKGNAKVADEDTKSPRWNHFVKERWPFAQREGKYFTKDFFRKSTKKLAGFVEEYFPGGGSGTNLNIHRIPERMHGKSAIRESES